jgi:hypothetical protein
VDGQYSHEKLSCFEELSGGRLLELGRRSFSESGSATLFLDACTNFSAILVFSPRFGWR